MSSPVPASSIGEPARHIETRSLFGFTLQSDFSFSSPLPAAAGSPDLVFTHRQAPVRNLKDLAPVFSSPYTRDGESISKLYRLGEREILRFDSGIDFEITGPRIDCVLSAPAYRYLVELRFLGPVVSYWMECRGLPTLHAAAVEIDDQAVVFLAANRGGKTALAASLVQAGHRILSDDILVVEMRAGVFFGRPGYPQMRMWPDDATHFLGHYEDLEIVHPAYTKRRVPVGAGGLGRFCGVPRRLVCLYILRRESIPEIEIAPIPRRDAIIELVRCSFSPHLVQAAGLQPRRLEEFASLVRQVPVRRLTYPSGYEHLPVVVEAVRRDLRQLEQTTEVSR